MQTINPILLEIYRHRFQAIAEEMGVTLCRSAYSSNIKERKDFSCALFDTQGEAIAQADHLPVHLGSMPASVQAALKVLNFAPGDSALINDPFAGGTHLPDITMIDPVFLPGETKPRFYVANRAHHADVGGMSPGSMPLSSEIFQEGLRIPPLKWRKAGQINTEVLALILNNVRTPQEREGDLLAQWAANQTGGLRLIALCQQYGTEEVIQLGEELQSYAARSLRQQLLVIPEGVYRFADLLDDDGRGQQDLNIQVKVQIQDGQAIIDFSGSAQQTAGCVNTIEAVTRSAVMYAFRCLLPAHIPTNSGLMRPLTILAPLGSVVNACFPSAVVGGNVETSQRIVDVVLGALAQALPGQIPAASCGSMNNLLLGGQTPAGQPFAYYETLAGGMGAHPQGPGSSGMHSHMTNTLNTPIEALELSFPFRVHAYHLNSDSGGSGQHQGGEGLVREIEALCDSQLTILSERRRHAAYGLAGGEPGQPGRNLRISPKHPEGESLPAKYSCHLRPGERVRIETPGGGGYGPPKARVKPAII